MNRKHVTRSRRYIETWRPLLNIKTPITVALSNPGEEPALNDAFACITDLGDKHHIELNEEMEISSLQKEFKQGLEELILHEMLHIKNEAIECKVAKYLENDKVKQQEIAQSIENVLDEVANAMVRTRRFFSNLKKRGSKNGNTSD